MPKTRNIFLLLWNLVEEAQKADDVKAVVGKYSRVIDDRLENSEYSASTDGLKLYTTKQLREELKERDCF